MDQHNDDQTSNGHPEQDAHGGAVPVEGEEVVNLIMTTVVDGSVDTTTADNEPLQAVVQEQSDNAKPSDAADDTLSANIRRGYDRLVCLGRLLHMPRGNRHERRAFNAALKERAVLVHKSPRTLQRWIAAYDEAGGPIGLNSKYKGRQLQPEVREQLNLIMDYAVRLRVANPTMSVLNLIDEMEVKFPELRSKLTRPTVQRHLQQRHCSKLDVKQDPELRANGFFSRFEHRSCMDFVQGDLKYGPKCLNEEGRLVRTYIVVWIDDKSRFILSMGVFTSQEQYVTSTTLRDVVNRYGLFKAAYTDNGSIYKSRALHFACQVLGILMKHARVQHPESKGKVEGFNSTLSDLKHKADSYGGTLSVRAFIKMSELWVEEYNNRVHSSLDNCSPREMFYSEWSPAKMLKVSPTLVERAFLECILRKVKKDGSVQYKGKFYLLPGGSANIGSQVEIAVGRNGKSIAVSLIDDRLNLIPLKRLDPTPEPNRYIERAEGFAANQLPAPREVDKGYGIKPVLAKRLMEWCDIDFKDYPEELFEAAAKDFMLTGDVGRAAAILKGKEVPEHKTLITDSPAEPACDDAAAADTDSDIPEDDGDEYCGYKCFIDHYNDDEDKE